MQRSVTELLYETRIDGEAYAVLDGAAIPDLVATLFDLDPEYECLYRGELEPDIAAVAPYLVRLRRTHPFTQWVLERCKGKHWGIFAVSDADLTALQRHFRRFLTVHTEDGKPVLFRYYDGRVLSEFLPSCNEEQTTAMFGPVLRYVYENLTGLLQYTDAPARNFGEQSC